MTHGRCPIIYTYTLYCAGEQQWYIVDKVLDSYPYDREFYTNIGRDSLFQIKQYNIP